MEKGERDHHPTRLDSARGSSRERHLYLARE